MKRLAYVYMGKKFAGILEEKESGFFTFSYNTRYLNNSKNLPISLNFPLREEAYQSETLFPFFDGLIPEGWLLSIATRNWKLNPKDRMGLLLSTCQDCIGAVSVFETEQNFFPRGARNGK